MEDVKEISEAEIGHIVILRAVVLGGPNSQGQVPVGFISADGAPWSNGSDDLASWYLCGTIPLWDEQRTQSRIGKMMVVRYAREAARKAGAKVAREARKAAKE